MISVLQQPGSISFSKNQVVYKFFASDVMGNAYGPKAASAQITTTDQAYPIGASLKVSWTDADGLSKFVDFAFNDTPTGESQLQAQPSGQLSLQYFASIAEKIGNHHLISPYFTVDSNQVGTDFQILITAIDTSLSWSVNFTETNTGDVVTSNTSTPATADNTPDNYGLLVDIFLEETCNGVYNKIATLEGDPDPNGIIVFDIAEMLSKEIAEGYNVPPVPNFNNTAPLIADNIRNHYVRYREIFDGSEDDWTNISEKKILHGGIKTNLFAAFDFFASMSETNSFMTWYPDGKLLSKDQPEYIAWYNYQLVPREIKLEVTLVNVDGTSTIISKHDIDPITVEANDVCLIPVGYSQLDLSAQAGLEIKKYLVRVKSTNDTDYFSQSKSYFVDSSYRQDNRYIMYLNSFSVPEVLRCTGTQDKSLKVEAEESERVLPVGYQSLESQSIQFNESFANEFIYRTGYLNKYEVDCLQELLIYNNAYEIHEDGYVALKITSKSYDLYNTRQKLNSLQFKAELRFKDKSYSNINIPLSPLQSGWANNPNEFWWGENQQPWTN